MIGSVRGLNAGEAAVFTSGIGVQPIAVSVECVFDNSLIPRDGEGMLALKLCKSLKTTIPGLSFDFETFNIGLVILVLAKSMTEFVKGLMYKINIVVTIFVDSNNWSF